MDKDQLQRERRRLQAALDGYNAVEPVPGRHVGLMTRIANLDRIIEMAPMPKGPRGEKRPADVIGRAIHVTKIAAGEIEDERDPVRTAAAELGSRGGKKRAENMTAERRSEIAKMAAAKRWGCRTFD